MKPVETIAVFLLFLLFALNIFCGSIDIPASDVLDVLMGRSIPGHESWSFIILENRIPGAITALLCGAALATSGLLLQTAFRNPLAGPSILGIDSGANLGVAIVLLLIGTTGTLGTFLNLSNLQGSALIVFAAMLGAMAIMFLLTIISRILKSTLMLLITGVMISYIASSLISLLQFGASEQGLQNFVVWGLGSFQGLSLERLPMFAVLILVGLVCSLLLIKPLDALLLGPEYAQNLGVKPQRMRQQLLFITGLLTATTTAFCGPISFIGLATPHIARMMGFTTHLRLMPMTMVLGACIALLCNLLCTIPETTVLPINVMTPLLGAPVILWVMLKGR